MSIMCITKKIETLIVMIQYISSLLFSEFDLEKERNVLDEQGVKIADNQENSQKNRRKLAESTKGIWYITPIQITWLTSKLYVGERNRR